MGVRKIPMKKYRADLYCVTWHAANEAVYLAEEKEWFHYSNMDGDHCYFYRLVEYLEAGWDIYKLSDEGLGVTLTGDVWPLDDVLKEKRVRNGLYGFIVGWKVADHLICERNIGSYYSDTKKVDKVIDEVLESLRKRPIRDFVCDEFADALDKEEK